MRGEELTDSSDDENFDDYYFEHGGDWCYIVLQNGNAYKACRNSISTTQGFLDFFRKHNDSEWSIVADIVVAESPYDAIVKIKRINFAALLVAVLCVVNIIALICNPLQLYNFIVFGVVVVFYRCLHVFLRGMRSTQLNDLLASMTFTA